MIHLIILPIIFFLALWSSIKAIIHLIQAYIVQSIGKSRFVYTKDTVYRYTLLSVILWTIYYFTILLFEYLTYSTYAALDY